MGHHACEHNNKDESSLGMVYVSGVEPLGWREGWRSAKTGWTLFRLCIPRGVAHVGLVTHGHFPTATRHAQTYLDRNRRGWPYVKCIGIRTSMD